MSILRKFSKVFCLLILYVLHPGVMVSQSVKEVSKTVSLSPDGTVSVDTFKGSLTVTPWDSPQVEIHARVEPDGTSADEAKRVQDTEIRINASANSVHIKSDYDKLKRKHSGFLGIFGGNSGNLPFVHYSIKMPRTAQLHIKDFKSKVKVVDLRSNVKINTFKGTVVISGLDGALDLKTHKGDAHVELINLARRSHFETFKGDVEIVMPKDKGFDLDSDLGRRGNLDSDFELRVHVQDLHARETKYRGSINGGGPLLSLKTYKGHFRLRQR